MKKLTEQMEKWAGQFGREYTDRNAISLEQMDALYAQRYGKSRTELNALFLAGIDRASRVLEVGSNVGNQLACLQRMGFVSLYGIEVQPYAVELSKSRTKGINIIEGSAFDVPFKDAYFDLVLTSGLLIHISPNDISHAMQEIHRCTRKYIWGLEYYSSSYSEIPYREETGVLWKADFARLYCEQFHDLRVVKEEHLKYLDSDSVDTMFLLEKR